MNSMTKVAESYAVCIQSVKKPSEAHQNSVNHGQIRTEVLLTIPNCYAMSRSREKS